MIYIYEKVLIGPTIKEFRNAIKNMEKLGWFLEKSKYEGTKVVLRFHRPVK